MPHMQPYTKVRRPDWEDLHPGRVGWIAPGGDRYPRLEPNPLIEDLDSDPADWPLVRTPPDDSGIWVVVWWSLGYQRKDRTRAGFYQWEPVTWLEVVQQPPSP